MRIGVDCNSLTRELTGVGTYTYRMLKYFIEENQENEYYLYSHKPLVVDFVGKNVRLVIRPSVTVVDWYIFALPSQIKKHKLDIFWEPGNRLPRFPRSKTKLVVTVHDLACLILPQYASWKSALMEKLYLKKTCQQASTIISISNATRKDIVNYLDINETKIHTIYNPVHVKNPSSEELATSNVLAKNDIHDKYFLFVGTISPRKNIVTIIDAYENFRDLGNRAQLVLAGKLAWKKSSIESRLRSCKYSNDIILTGYISNYDKWVLYNNALCLLFPSIYEGFGYPLLEAMQAKLVPITANVSAMPEIAAEAALYIDDPFDSIALSKQMTNVLNMSAEQLNIYISKGQERLLYFQNQPSEEKTLQTILSC